MRIADLLVRAAEKVPSRPAAVFADGEMTYSELLARARGAAKQLAGARRVALLVRPSPASLAAFWGAQLAGAETVDVPLHVGEEPIAQMLEECAADVVVREEDAEGLTAPSSDGAPAAGGDVAVIIYTSGTTGRPKGVMLTHENLLSNVEAAAERMPLSDGDRLLVVVPMYFIHGRMQLLAHARVAGTLCFSEGFQFPKRVLDELVRYRVQGMSGVPFHFATLLSRTHIADTPLPDLRYVLVTGGALDRSLSSTLRRRLPNVELHTAYGSTEASPRITHASPDELAARPGTVGRALPGVEVAIVGSDRRPVPSGALGEIVCRGPNVMAGYVSGDQIETGRVDEDGRLYTGDLGRLDGDGYLHLAGRVSDMIKTAGERIFPREIEAVLERHPAVLEAAAVGVPDRMLGERIVALVVPRSDVEPAALVAHARSWLPHVRSPREVHLVDALPKTASSKLRRGELLELVEARRSS